jgi:hypothetical protein
MTRLATLLLSLGPAKLVRPTGSFWVFVPLVEGVSPLEGLVKQYLRSSSLKSMSRVPLLVDIYDSEMSRSIFSSKQADLAPPPYFFEESFSRPGLR